MVTTIAVLMAPSDATSTPAKIRESVDGFAKQLRGRIASARRAPSPFTEIASRDLN
jgi:hypothetical protein